MHEWSEDAYTAATMYYVHGETMETIARQLGTSRSSVSRSLKEARQSGLVRISLADPDASSSSLAGTLSRLFGVRVHLVPVRDGSSDVQRLDRVARVAGPLLSSMVSDGVVVGVAWGTTLAAVAHHVPRRDVAGVTIVQLNGATNNVTSGIPYVGAIISEMATAWDASTVFFPVPAFFDFAETRRAMWRERSVRNVLSVQRRVDLAVFGVGSLEAAVPSHVYSAGYLDESDLAQVHKQRVVGDVCTILLRVDGSWRDIELNARASGQTPHELQQIPRRLCVVAGVSKAAPLLGALRAKVATDVVVDDATARAVLDLI